MEGSNSQPLPKIEGMRVLPMCAGVETERVAVSLPGQCDKPLDHRLAMSFGARIFVSDEIVHVKRLPARQHVLYAETRDRDDSSLVLKRGQLISFSLLSLNATNKLSGNQRRTKLAHYRKAAGDLGGSRSDLDSSHRPAPRLPVFSGAQVRDVRDMVA